jgi:hypothetical protein
MSDAEFGPTLLLSVIEKSVADPDVRGHVRSNRPIQYDSKVTARRVKMKSSCCINKNLLPSNGNLLTEPLPRNGRCLQIHRLTTALYATILTTVRGLALLNSSRLRSDTLLILIGN